MFQEHGTHGSVGRGPQTQSGFVWEVRRRFVLPTYYQIIVEFHSSKFQPHSFQKSPRARLQRGADEQLAVRLTKSGGIRVARTRDTHGRQRQLCGTAAVSKRPQDRARVEGQLAVLVRTRAI